LLAEFRRRTAETADAAQTAGEAALPGVPEDSLFADTSSDKELSRIITQEIPETEYRQKIEERFVMGTEEGKAVFQKYYAEGILTDTKNKGVSYFDPETNTIHLNAKDDANDPRGSGTAYFHEWMHCVDHKAGQETGGEYLSTSNPDFGNALRNDFENYVKQFMADNEINDMEEAYDRIEKQLKIKQNANHQIADLFNMLSNGKIIGGYRHKQDYIGKAGNLEKDGFAHMGGAQFNGPKRRLLEKYFPTAYTIFLEMLKRISGG
jgi:hypothetical protein